MYELLTKIDPSEIFEIYSLLEDIKFPINKNKTGRARTFGIHQSMILGYVKARITRKIDLSAHTKHFPELYKAILEFGKRIVPFEFNSIYVNKNVVCPRHLDKNNNGVSLLVSFGDYDGCNLVIEGIGEFDTNLQPIIFDGSKLYHYNTNLKGGTKYSLIFFN